MQLDPGLDAPTEHFGAAATKSRLGETNQFTTERDDIGLQ